MAILEMKNIVKKFGAEGFRAVDGVSLRVESGEMLLEGRDRPCPSGIYCRAVF